MYNISLLLHFFLFFLNYLFIKNRIRTFWYIQFARGFSVPHNTARKSEHFQQCSTPNLYHYIHQLRIMSWVNSWVARLLCLLAYVPLYRLG